MSYGPVFKHNSYYGILLLATKKKKKDPMNKNVVGGISIDITGFEGRVFLFNLPKLLTINTIGMFLLIFRVSFKISRFDIFDNMKFCVLGSRTKSIKKRITLTFILIHFYRSISVVWLHGLQFAPLNKIIIIIIIIKTGFVGPLFFFNTTFPN